MNLKFKKKTKSIIKKETDFYPQGDIFKSVQAAKTTKVGNYRNFSNLIAKKKKKQREVPKITLQYLKQCVFLKSN